MAWETELTELERRRALAAQMGGEERVARQHATGRMAVRERIAALVDEGSFREVGGLAGVGDYDADGELTGFLPANMVVGEARLDGRRTAIQGDDFTVRGGAADAAIWQKMVWAERYAHDARVPLVRLVDGTGGGGSVKSLETMGFTYVPFVPGWELAVENLSLVPVAAAALGPVAGLGFARVVQSHFSVGGQGDRPALRRRAARRQGGDARVARQGGARRLARAGARGRHRQRGGLRGGRLRPDPDVPLLPAGIGLGGAADRRGHRSGRPPRAGAARPRPRGPAPALRDPLGARARSSTAGSVFELGARHGRSLVDLARAPRRPAGRRPGLRSQALGRRADRATPPTSSCASSTSATPFRLPVVNLVDQPGFVIGTGAEQANTMRRGARALAAIYQSSVPWAAVLLRKVYGIAGASHAPHHRLALRVAWPSGDWGSLPIAGGLEAAYRRELEASEDPVALRQEIQDRLDAVRSPFRTAEKFGIEDVIDPADTRPILCDWAKRAHELVALDAHHGPVTRGMRP